MARWPVQSPFLNLGDGPFTSPEVQLALNHPGVKEVTEHTMQGPRRHYKNVPASMHLHRGDFVNLPSARHIVVDGGQDDGAYWLDLMEVPPGVPENEVLEQLSKRPVRPARQGPRDSGRHWVERLTEDNDGGG